MPHATPHVSSDQARLPRRPESRLAGGIGRTGRRAPGAGRRASRPARGLILTGCLLGTMLATGCTQFRDVWANASSDVSEWTDTVAGRHVTDPTVSFATTGPIEVDVQLFAGNVKVDVDRNATETRVKVIRRAEFGSGRGNEAGASLLDIDVQVDVEPGELGQRLVIRSSTAADESWNQSTDIEITTPEVEQTFIRTGGGHIVAKDIGSDMDLETADGNIRVITRSPLVTDVDLTTLDGTIDLRGAFGSRGFLDLVAEDGEAFQQIESGRVRILDGNGINRVAAVVDEGSNRITLRSTRGDIRFAIVPRPHAVGRWIIE